jgi:hypothetical protein
LNRSSVEAALAVRNNANWIPSIACILRISEPPLFAAATSDTLGRRASTRHPGRVPCVKLQVSDPFFSFVPLQEFIYSIAPLNHLFDGNFTLARHSGHHLSQKYNKTQ